MVRELRIFTAFQKLTVLKCNVNSDIGQIQHIVLILDIPTGTSSRIDQALRSGLGDSFRSVPKRLDRIDRRRYRIHPPQVQMQFIRDTFYFIS